MPLLEHEASRRGRLRVFRRAQLPFACGVVFVTIVTAIVLPEQFATASFLSGIAVGVLSTLAAVMLPWERWPVNVMVLVAIFDLLAVALIRIELLAVAPAVSLLYIFPVLWLAYGFSQRMMLVAVAGTLIITALPYVLRQRAPVTALEWLNLALMPMFTLGIALAVNVGARQLRRSQRAVRDQADQLQLSLQRALGAEIVAESIIETVDAGIAFYTAEGRLRLANEQARNMVALAGFSLDAPPHAGEHVLAEDRATPIALHEQIIPRALRGELISNHLEWLGPAGRQRAILAASKRVHGIDGELLGTVIAAHDVTDLANAISVREQFLRTVTHELRTPLTAIHGYLELVIDDAETDAPGLLRALSTIQRNATKLEQRVQELLAAADAELHLTLSDVDAVALVTDVVNEMDVSTGRIIILLDGAQSVMVRADGAQLRRAVLELITNALKFAPEDSVVTVEIAPASGGVSITVRDGGIGMNPEELAQAFDKFYRTKSAQDRAIQGFGLGLHSAKQMAEAHHGSLTLESAAGEGTTAVLALPVRPAS